MMYIGIHSQCHAPTVGGVTPLSLSSHDRYSSSNKLRSSWRVKTVVGFFIVITSFYCLLLLLDSHFQFGTQLVDKRNEGVFQSNTKTAAAADDDEDDDNDDPASSIFTAGNPPCPFPPPEVTGFKNWTLYPKESYDGLSILRPRKESILQTAFPGCVPFVLPKQVKIYVVVLKKNLLPAYIMISSLI